MKRLMSVSTAVVSLFALVLGASLALAADAVAPAKNSINGVVTKDGKGVEGVTVRLFQVPAAGEQKAEKAAAGEKVKKEAFKETTTGADGKFTFTDVPVGDYAIVAGGKGFGHGKSKVSVSADKAADVTIDLKEGKGGDKQK
jgi:hypothetical protein